MQKIASIIIILSLVYIVQCRRFNASQVYGSEKPDFCFTAAILISMPYFKSDRFVCTGAVVSPTNVVSTKSSMHVDYMPYLGRVHNYLVRIGSRDPFSGGVVIPVESITTYPSDDRDVDLVVFTLKTPLLFDQPTICPIRLADEKHNVYLETGRIVQTIGYKATISSDRLHWMTAPIIDRGKCDDFFAESRNGRVNEEHFSDEGINEKLTWRKFAGGKTIFLLSNKVVSHILILLITFQV